MGHSPEKWHDIDMEAEMAAARAIVAAQARVVIAAEATVIPVADQAEYTSPVRLGERSVSRTMYELPA